MDTDVDKNETEDVEKEGVEMREATDKEDGIENEGVEMREATAKEDGIEKEGAGNVGEEPGEPQGDGGNGGDNADEVIYIEVDVDKHTSQVI